MPKFHRTVGGAVLVAAAIVFAAAPALAQKAGGTLRVFHRDSPASMSIHEESTIAGQGPMMGVFNNLVMYDQSVPQSGLNRSCRISPANGHGMRTAPA